MIFEALAFKGYKACPLKFDYGFTDRFPTKAKMHRQLEDIHGGLTPHHPAVGFFMAFPFFPLGYLPAGHRWGRFWSASGLADLQ